MIFDPTPDYFGAASVQIITNDQGNTGAGGPLTDDDTVAITVNAVDDAPINNMPGAQVTDEDNTLVFSSGSGNAISISDIDAGGNDLEVTLNATNGTLTLSGLAGLAFTTGDGTDDATMIFTGTAAAINTALEGMTFDPTPDYFGAASVQIITNDQGNTGAGGPLADTDTVIIAVNSVNDAPTVPDSNIATAEDVPYLAALGVNDLLISSNDADGDMLSVTTTPIAAPSNGLLALNSDGTFTYTPDANFNGTDAFTYEISDGNGGVAQATVMIDVVPVNDAPTVPGASITLNEDVPYAATLGVDDLLINSVDIDGDTLTVSSTPVSGPTNGVLILSGIGTFTYTPDADFNGSDSFVYQIVDSNGGSAQALVTINIAPINDAPVTLDDALNAQPNTFGLIDGAALMANDTDVDGDALTLVSLTQPPSGFVALNPDGTIVYIPSGGFVGVDSFTYTVSDPSGAQATGLVVIQVSIDEDDSDVLAEEMAVVLRPQAIDQSAVEEDEPEQGVASSGKSASSVSLLVNRQTVSSASSISPTRMRRQTCCYFVGDVR